MIKGLMPENWAGLKLYTVYSHPKRLEFDSYVSQIQYIYTNACRDNHTTKVSCLERHHAFIIITIKRMQTINF